MKALTILTQDFRQDVESALNLRCHTVGALYTARGKINTEDLACLLERIIILAHPVYGHSPKLADMAQQLRHTESHQNNVEELARYLDENDLLHLEGYAAFRMADYRHKLDMMMYCLIKKLSATSDILDWRGDF